MRLKTKLTGLLCVVLILPMAAAQAASYYCSGAVNLLGINGYNVVTVQLSTTTAHYICSMDSQGSYVMSTGACKSLFSQLLSAKTTGMSVTLYYDNAYTCATIPSWTAAYDMNWVSGPN